MTERSGSGYDDEGGQRPSGRGAVTERLAGQDGGAHEIDLTDEATRREQSEDDDAGRDSDRESSGAFEPAAPTADPPADATRPGSANIFDVERAGQDAPRDEAPGITPTPVPVDDPAAAPVEGLPEPPSTASTGAEQAGPPSLLGSLDAGDIRNRFLDIQAGFVDEPRQAVEAAGRFVDDLVQQVVDALQGQRGQLTTTPAEGSTEDLRLALRAYRQFVDRLLGLAS